MNILLTNDDSHASPLFRFAIDILKPLGQVTIVVPKEEQSWTGKSMSRFKPLIIDEIRLQDDTAYCLDGTPADCANVGVYHTCEQRPDLVVSGINIGLNTGLSFFFSSGTIGACLEANIAGIPAIALSQSLERGVFQNWTENRQMPEDTVARLREQTTELLDHVFEKLFAREDFFSQPVTWNVNLPYTPAPDWEIVPTVLGQTMYGSCFNKVGDQFRHGLGLTDPDSRENADGEVLRQGHVSVTCIDMRTFAQTTMPL
ncbi:5'/3'-nucleotidase SurE [Candidatus Entotheonella palauensis]|nr:5'/3'-nucleotidase SurE [Candidatus Entotheonella palauensis]